MSYVPGCSPWPRTVALVQVPACGPCLCWTSIFWKTSKAGGVGGLTSRVGGGSGCLTSKVDGPGCLTWRRACAGMPSTTAVPPELATGKRTSYVSGFWPGWATTPRDQTLVSLFLTSTRSPAWNTRTGGAGAAGGGASRGGSSRGTAAAGVRPASTLGGPGGEGLAEALSLSWVAGPGTWASAATWGASGMDRAGWRSVRRAASGGSCSFAPKLGNVQLVFPDTMCQ
mmetsp:Transcript_11587/g.32632  ORF Transcript_11587/g.32632 Transcript_11587/m.32632 type:complete len:227 (+) Transcript_11587:137-817(+)